MALTIFEFQDKFINYFFLIKATQFEKTGSVYKVLIPPRNLKNKFYFRNQNSLTFFAPIPRSYFEKAIYVTFSRWISTELEKCKYIYVHSKKH